MKQWKFIQFVLLGMFLFSGISFAQEEEREDDLGDVSDAFQEHFFEGLKQSAIENHERAIAAFSKWLEENPNNAIVQYEIGKAYLKTEEYSLAQSSLEKAIELDDKNVWYLDSLYEAYDKTNQDDKAIEILKKLSVFHPDYKLDLVKYYFNKTRFDQALSLMDELDEETGINSDRDLLRKLIYQRSGYSESKIAFYKKRISQQPANEDHYLQIIYEYSNQNDVINAKAIAQQLLKENPNSEKVHLGLYKFYLEDNEKELAYNSLKTVLKSQSIEEPSKRKLLNDYLRFLRNSEPNPAQIEELAAIIKDSANNSRLTRIITDYYTSIGDLNKAVEVQTSAGVDMNDFNSVRSYLIALSQAKEHEKVIVTATEALELYPSQPLLYMLNGVALNSKNLPDKAIESLEIGLEYIIDDPILESDFYYQMAQSYKIKQNESKHKEFLLKAKQTLENAN